MRNIHTSGMPSMSCRKIDKSTHKVNTNIKHTRKYVRKEKEEKRREEEIVNCKFPGSKEKKDKGGQKRRERKESEREKEREKKREKER